MARVTYSVHVQHCFDIYSNPRDVYSRGSSDQLEHVTDQLAIHPDVNKASIAAANKQSIMNWADENQILSTGTESHDDGEGAWNVATSRRAKRRRRRSSQEKIG